MKKINLIRSINAAVWTVLAVVVMVWAYKAWSANGSYTAMSFFTSLFMHGGFCYLIGYLIDEKIRNYYNNK